MEAVTQKLTCPVCNAHTSSVLDAFADERECPHCGVDHDTAEKVRDAQARAAGLRKQGADEELTQRYIDAEREAARYKTALQSAESKLDAIARALKDE